MGCLGGMFKCWDKVLCVIKIISTVLGWVETTQKEKKGFTVNHLVFINNGFASCVYFQCM